MAAYPSLRQSYGSGAEISYGTVVDRAVSGKSRFRSFYSQARYTFNITHECNATEKDSILSHYAGDSTTSFSFTFMGDGATYTVRYLNQPTVRLVSSGGDWVVTTKLIQV